MNKPAPSQSPVNLVSSPLSQVRTASLPSRSPAALTDRANLPDIPGSSYLQGINLAEEFCLNQSSRQFQEDMRTYLLEMLDRLPPHRISQSPRSHSGQEERVDDDTIRIDRIRDAAHSVSRSEPTPDPVRRPSHTPPAVRLPSSTTGSLSSVPLSPPRENLQVQQVINKWLGTEPVSALLRQTADASRSPSLHPVGTSRQTSSHSLTSTGSESSSEGVIQIPTQAPAPIRLPDQESMRRLAEELARNVSEESVRMSNTTPIGFSPLRSEELPRNATPGPSHTRGTGVSPASSALNEHIENSPPTDYNRYRRDQSVMDTNILT
ncbi:hypothetical protein RhiLY_10411 [Ceratobasidium sp. AG-Ba]|nr:hypothetical protein RhiLY_10411 [Ceratobasidium sp. AG-Ba]